jgi:hypothetical protein
MSRISPTALQSFGQSFPLRPCLFCDILLLQMGLQGPLGQLQRGVSDVVSEVEVINEDDARQRWTATSAELWPVRFMWRAVCSCCQVPAI